MWRYASLWLSWQRNSSVARLASRGSPLLPGGLAHVLGRVPDARPCAPSLAACAIGQGCHSVDKKGTPVGVPWRGAAWGVANENIPCGGGRGCGGVVVCGAVGRLCCWRVACVAVRKVAVVVAAELQCRQARVPVFPLAAWRPGARPGPQHRCRHPAPRPRRCIFMNLFTGGRRRCIGGYYITIEAGESAGAPAKKGSPQVGI